MALEHDIAGRSRSAYAYSHQRPPSLHFRSSSGPNPRASRYHFAPKLALSRLHPLHAWLRHPAWTSTSTTSIHTTPSPPGRPRRRTREWIPRVQFGVHLAPEIRERVVFSSFVEGVVADFLTD
ncbi:hypothetical protein CC2G_000016 [Coprinopsis cinerea AmutBmut pab1-1]|nr:hypothetical protein CC2G_000016 [Coprinopsis cinerea AmutBmut pab1-1]